MANILPVKVDFARFTPCLRPPLGCRGHAMSAHAMFTRVAEWRGLKGGGGGLTGMTAVQQVFHFLGGPHDVLRASATCWRWRELACADAVWLVKIKREGMLAKSGAFEVVGPMAEVYGGGGGSDAESDSEDKSGGDDAESGSEEYSEEEEEEEEDEYLRHILADERMAAAAAVAAGGDEEAEDAYLYSKEEDDETTIAEEERMVAAAVAAGDDSPHCGEAEIKLLKAELDRPMEELWRELDATVAVGGGDDLDEFERKIIYRALQIESDTDVDGMALAFYAQIFVLKVSALLLTPLPPPLASTLPPLSARCRVTQWSIKLYHPL